MSEEEKFVLTTNDLIAVLKHRIDAIPYGLSEEKASKILIKYLQDTRGLIQIIEQQLEK